MRNKGFTMIELVMVIVILAILAAVAIPRFIDLQTQAETSAEAGVVGGVRAGIATFYINEAANNPPAEFPAALDAAGVGTTASTLTPFFVNVIEQGGLTDGTWTKDPSDAFTYIGPTGATYTYTPGAVLEVGSFLQN